MRCPSVALLIKSLSFFCIFGASLSHGEDEEKGPSNRIDFGNSYVQGQSIKSGAVYLMNRKKNQIQSMLEKRESYRDDILADYPDLYQPADLKNSNTNQPTH